MASRGRWWKRTVAAVVVVGVLAGAAELALRLIIPATVSTVVRDRLAVPEDAPVDVSLGGSALLYALTGRIGDVTVDARDVPLIDGITGRLVFTAASLPFDPTSGELSDARGTLALGADQLDPLVALVTRGVADSGDVREGVLVVSRDITLFGVTAPVTAGLALGVEAGDITVEPASVGVAGFDLSAEQLVGATGATLDGVLRPHTVCVADQLPAGVTLTSIDLSAADEVRVSAMLAPGIFSDAAMREPGTCEPESPGE